MKNKKITLLAECEDCNFKFDINAKRLVQQEFMANGQSIFLTYYDCPKCGRRHFVQIDDEISLAKLKVCKSQIINCMVMKHKGNIQKQSDSFKRNRRDLSNYRMKLMKRFTGVICFDTKTKTSFELRFSV